MIEHEDSVDQETLTELPVNSTGYSPEKPTKGELLLPFIIMLGILAIDQFTKQLVEARIPLYGYWAPIPSLENIFRIVHTSNSGAVFGLFQGTGIFFAVLGILVTLGIAYFNFTLPRDQWLLRIALGLQLGGAVGNLTDRLRREGHVTDFIDIGPWYIFNIADMAIVSGVILFAFVLWRDNRRLKQNQAEETAALNSLPAASSSDPSSRAD